MVASTVSIQTQDFDLSHEVAALRASHGHIGAVCSFIGTVRAGECGVQALELEHYPGMTELAIADLVQQAANRFDLAAVRIIHRVGLLQPQDQIVLVAVAAAHRDQAFAACEFLMDHLKTQAPFWKKEHTPKGVRWVEARASDEAAQARWSQIA